MGSYREAWRLFAVSADGMPMTLFHPFEGSRVLPTDKRLRAEKREVHNPGKKYVGHSYTSGWHVAMTREGVTKYLNRFTADRELRLCRVLVQNSRPKPRTRTEICLAGTMKILSEDWKKAQVV